jgi:long-chain acyl-CoA synthetase
LQKFASQVLVGISSTTPVKRMAYELAMRAGRRHVKALWEGRREGAFSNTLARHLVFRPLLEKLGLDQLELLVSGGAPLPDETMAIWQAWGVNTMQLYGQTETAGGIITGQRGWMPRPGNVGDAPPGVELRLADTDDGRGEILVRSPDLFQGYWGQPDATAGVVDAEGWLHTGDAGETDGGNLRLVDRVRDFIVTSGGKTISPAYVENLVRASHYVAEVMVVGHGRKYLTALVEIDFDAVSEWARSKDIAYAGFTSLAMHEGVRGLLAAEIERANSLLARVEQVKDFRILPKALDPEEEGEPVTPTRKVKRALMVQRFRALVEEMYDDREDRLLADGAGDLLRS